MPPKPILVAGGGLAAALGLAQKGLAVTVLERAPVLGELGADIASIDLMEPFRRRFGNPDLE